MQEFEVEESISGEQKQYLSKVTREAGYAFSGKIFGLLFGFVAQAIYARFLGADLLGVFVLAVTVLNGITILTTFGFEFSLVRYIAKYVSLGQKSEARSVFRLGMRWSMTLAVIGLVAIILFRQPIALRIFKEPRLTSALVVIALAVFPFSFMRTLSGALRGLKDIRSVTIGYEVSDRVVRFGTFLLLYVLGMRLFGIVTATVVSTSVSALVLVYFLRRKGPYLFKRGESEKAVIPRKDIVVYSGAMLADSLVSFSMQHSGRIVLGIFLVSADVGVFNITALIANMILFVLLSFTMIFSPVIADLYHRDRSDLLNPLFKSVTRWAIILSLPVFAWIVVAGQTTLGVFGSEFMEGYRAMVLMSIGFMIAVAAGPVGVALAMTGYQKWNVLNAIVTAVVGVLLMVYLVPRMGLAGAGIAAGASNALVKIARVIQVRFLLKMTPYDRSTLKVVATAAVTVTAAILAARYIPIPRGIEWSALVFVVSVMLVGLMTFLLGIEAEDKLVLKTVLRKFRRMTGGAGPAAGA